MPRNWTKTNKKGQLTRPRPSRASTFGPAAHSWSRVCILAVHLIGRSPDHPRLSREQKRQRRAVRANPSLIHFLLLVSVPSHRATVPRPAAGDGVERPPHRVRPPSFSLSPSFSPPIHRILWQRETRAEPSSVRPDGGFPMRWRPPCPPCRRARALEGERAAVKRHSGGALCPFRGMFFFPTPRLADARRDREERRGLSGGATFPASPRPFPGEDFFAL